MILMVSAVLAAVEVLVPRRLQICCYVLDMLNLDILYSTFQSLVFEGVELVLVLVWPLLFSPLLPLSFWLAPITPSDAYRFKKFMLSTL